MTDLKSAIMGTSDPRALLLEAGVQGMQRKAGYVADVLTGDDGLPEFIYSGDEICRATDDSYWYDLGSIVYIIVDARICLNCRYQLNRHFDTIFFQYAEDPYIHCEICGSTTTVDDDIPF